MPQKQKTYIFLPPLTPTNEVPNRNDLPIINEDSFMEPLTPGDFGSTEAGVESQSEEEEEAEKTPTVTVFEAAHGLGVGCIPSSHPFTGIKQLQKAIDIAVCSEDNHNDGDKDIAQATTDALHHAELDSLFTVAGELEKISAELRKGVAEIAKSMQFKIDCDPKKYGTNRCQVVVAYTRNILDLAHMRELELALSWIVDG
ncbi:hypothetical protein R3P38DRAFT_2770185 [Favolaschia claudopus]|uniref:Uncharacterized protein n=1 Tax=Favolaschia claudopus TaxID=2862362 RepID=A0AAW0CPJ8_9AGAR